MDMKTNKVNPQKDSFNSRFSQRMSSARVREEGDPRIADKEKNQCNRSSATSGWP
jgi:hypothetical protein